MLRLSALTPTLAPVVALAAKAASISRSMVPRAFLDPPSGPHDQGLSSHLIRLLKNYPAGLKGPEPACALLISFPLQDAPSFQTVR